MLAVIFQGHADLADILWLVACILFAVVAVGRAMANDVLGSALAAGLTLGFLGFLVL